MPFILLRPPWAAAPAAKASAKAKAAVVLALAAPEVPPSLVWAPGERERLLETARERGRHRLDEAAQEDLVRVMIDGEPARTPHAWAHASYLFSVDDERVVRVWNHVAPERWYQVAWSDLPGCLLARCGLAVLPGLMNLLARSPQHALPYLGPVRSSALAPAMADALVRLKSGKAHASAWLVRHAEVAAPALLPAAVGKARKARSAAEAALRLLADQGEGEVVRAAARAAGPEAASAIDRLLAPDGAPAPVREPALPAFVRAAALPSPVLRGGAALPLEALENLLKLLAAEGEGAAAALAEAKRAFEPRSLADLGWALFSAWTLAGAPSAHKWAMLALGPLGDDEVARKLAAMVRRWPGESQHARAVLGLDVLGAIGSDIALMHLYGIAQKIRFKALEERAREKIAAIARARGLGVDELADRLVPDLGLDERGSVTLEYGARSFRIELDTALVARVHEGARLLAGLPKPGKDDDPELARAAEETFKALKKDLKTLGPQQLLRLELAMCARRGWTAADFEALIARHPVVGRIARGLVFGVRQRSGAVVGTFRVAEDATLADLHDRRFELDPARGAHGPDGDARVVIPHPLELAPLQVADRWGQVLAEYEIAQPFSQLDRETFTPTESERGASSLSRVEGVEVPTGKVLGLEARGWRKGPPQDSGGVWWLEKALGGSFTAELPIRPGIMPGAGASHPTQTLEAATLRRGTTEARFGEIHPVDFSELVRDLVECAGTLRGGRSPGPC